MKIIIITAFALLSIDGISKNNIANDLLAVPTQTKVTKTKGGIRGFKTVTEDVKPGVYANLACANPGENKCMFKISPSFVVTDLPQTELDNIDSKINETIKGGEFNNHFTYTSETSNKYLVVFEGTPETGLIKYVIYTQAEAQELGYDI